jgi:histidine ammonia-lyase
VYSVPTSANAEDHVSMGANEARHVLEMTEDLGHVLALELYTAAQALDFRQAMLNAARRLAIRGGWQALAAKVANAPREDHPHYAQFVAEVQQLTAALANAGDFHAGVAVRDAHVILRKHISFMHRDRAMDGEVQTVCTLVQQDAFRQPRTA